MSNPDEGDNKLPLSVKFENIQTGLETITNETVLSMENLTLQTKALEEALKNDSICGATISLVETMQSEPPEFLEKPPLHLRYLNPCHQAEQAAWLRNVTSIGSAGPLLHTASNGPHEQAILLEKLASYEGNLLLYNKEIEEDYKNRKEKDVVSVIPPNSK